MKLDYKNYSSQMVWVSLAAGCSCINACGRVILVMLNSGVTCNTNFKTCCFMMSPRSRTVVFLYEIKKILFWIFSVLINLLDIKHYLKGLKQYLISCCWCKTQNMSLKLGQHQYIFQLPDLL